MPVSTVPSTTGNASTRPAPSSAPRAPAMTSSPLPVPSSTRPRATEYPNSSSASPAGAWKACPISEGSRIMGDGGFDGETQSDPGGR